MTYPTFSELSLDELNKYTKDLKRFEQYFINEFKLPIYLMYGTLLGAIRDKDYISHDNDVDVAYLSSFNTQKEVYEERIVIMQKLDADGLIYRKETIGIKIKYCDNYMDLWTSWIDENNNYSVLPYSGLGSKETILPLKSHVFREETFLIPNDSNELLNKLYIRWQEPIKGNFRKHNSRFTFPT